MSSRVSFAFIEALILCLTASAFVDFLITWSSVGYRTERDLFLARAVLQVRGSSSNQMGAC